MIDATVYANTSSSILTWLTVGAAVLSVVFGLVAAFSFRALKRTESESLQISFPELFKILLIRHFRTRHHD
jgi:hypothetical protein